MGIFRLVLCFMMFDALKKFLPTRMLGASGVLMGTTGDLVFC